MAKANEQLKTTPIKSVAPKAPDNHPPNKPIVESSKKPNLPAP